MEPKKRFLCAQMFLCHISTLVSDVVCGSESDEKCHDSIWTQFKMLLRRRVWCFLYMLCFSRCYCLNCSYFIQSFHYVHYFDQLLFYGHVWTSAVGQICGVSTLLVLSVLNLSVFVLTSDLWTMPCLSDVNLCQVFVGLSNSSKFKIWLYGTSAMLCEWNHEMNNWFFKIIIKQEWIQRHLEREWKWTWTKVSYRLYDLFVYVYTSVHLSLAVCLSIIHLSFCFFHPSLSLSYMVWLIYSCLSFCNQSRRPAQRRVSVCLSGCLSVVVMWSNHCPVRLSVCLLICCLSFGLYVHHLQLQ